MLLSVNTLRPADIVVSTTNARISAVIRAGIASSVSHSMIYVGGSHVIEAIAEGVVRRPLATALTGATLAIALRRRNLTEHQRSAVIEAANQFARAKLPYDKVGAAGSGTNTGRGALLAGLGCSISLLFCAAGTAEVRENAKPENADRAFFCSELVARCFELAGAPVVEGAASAATPRHIRMATNLLYLGKLVDTPVEPPGIAPGSPL
jgi:phosphate/sulfate permease